MTLMTVYFSSYTPIGLCPRCAASRPAARACPIIPPRGSPISCPGIKCASPAKNRGVNRVNGHIRGLTGFQRKTGDIGSCLDPSSEFRAWALREIRHYYGGIPVSPRASQNGFKSPSNPLEAE
jgi:hypothetical protein